MTALAALLLVQADWRRFDLEGILLALPAAPKRVFLPGAPESVRNWTLVSGRDGVGISLQPSDPAKPADVDLADGLEAFRKGQDGKIVAQADVLRNGWPGLRATLSFPELGEIRFLAYGTGKGVVTVTAGGTDRGSAAFGKRVVESLELGDAFGRVPQKTAGPEWTRTALRPSTLSAEFPRAPRGGVAMAAPNSPFQPRTWVAQYGNRRYVATLVSPLKRPEAPTPAGRKWRTIGNINDGTLKSAGARLVARKESTFLGERSERMEGEADDGTTTILSEVTVKDEHTIVALAMVPKALRDSPEVARFFRSFRDESKAAGVAGGRAEASKGGGEAATR